MTTHGMETWLLDHLVRTGAMTETGVSRRARIRTCHCGARTLAGLDDPISCALEAIADPTPLSALGEALAVVEGRRTYALRTEGARKVLDPREADHIAARPAGATPREDVLRQHRCHTGHVAGALAAPSGFRTDSAALPPNSPPTF